MKIIFIFFLSFPLFAQVELVELQKLADEYLIKHSDQKEDEKWQKKYISMCEQRLKDSPDSSEQSFYTDKVLEWGADKGEKFVNLNSVDKKILIEGCRYFRIAVLKNLEFPRQIREELTQKVREKLKQFLKKKISEPK